ncbi:hypothetical protein TNCV_4183301 [Trichonephila clavipes]|nr:hypothetical protein TNCV_4183301 [Trichonephila clavipes]
MEYLSGQSFIPSNLGRVDEEMIPTARELSKVDVYYFLTGKQKNTKIIGNEPHESCIKSHYTAARGLLTTDLIILNHGQVTTLELSGILLFITSMPRQRGRTFEPRASALSTRQVFNGGRLELMTRHSRVRDLHTRLPQPCNRPHDFKLQPKDEDGI